jgi:hypothetical protein
MPIRECPEDKYTTFTHDSNHLLCAISLRTTGNIPYFHDLCQICIMPLDAEIRPIKKLIPFLCDIVPKQPDHIDHKTMTVRREDLSRVCRTGIPFIESGDLFINWFEKKWRIRKKKITPLLYDYPSKWGFIQNWLDDFFPDYFNRQYRDPLATAMFLNDYADVMVQKSYFGGLGFGALCSRLDIFWEKGQDLLRDCMCLGDVYRRMVRSCHILKDAPAASHHLPMHLVKKVLSHDPIPLQEIQNRLGNTCSLLEIMHSLAMLKLYDQIDVLPNDTFRLPEIKAENNTTDDIEDAIH